MIRIKNFIRRLLTCLNEIVREMNRQEDEEIKQYVDTLYREDCFNKSLFGIHQGRRW